MEPQPPAILKVQHRVNQMLTDVTVWVPVSGEYRIGFGPAVDDPYWAHHPLIEIKPWLDAGVNVVSLYHGAFGRIDIELL